MFRKILYPTDFSEPARKALRYVTKLREAGSKEVVILHVVEKEIVEAYEEAFAWAGKDVTTETEKLDEKLIKKARKQMEEDIKELEGLGFSVKGRVTIGNPWEEILKVTESEGVSLIVMGSHGCGRLSCKLEKLIGSTTENVVRHAKKPVLVVR
ncbi:MAG: universal stress protein [Archaeoglobaceae archaeon]|nr:universal stress protein [Archaeoglobaceae archaeon]